MKALRESRWLARLVGCTTLTLGLAGLVVAGSAPAQARVTFPSLTKEVAAFWGGNTATPVDVPALSGVTQVSAGGLHSLALRSDGTVWAWGMNNVGQLGDGTTASTEVPVQVTGLSQVTGISAGYDASGQLDSVPSSSPVTRPQQMTWTGSGITQLSAGYDHVLALRSNGTVLAWGDNSQGELGDGSEGGTSGPVQVASLGSVSQVSAGAQFSLAMGAVTVFAQPSAS